MPRGAVGAVEVTGSQAPSTTRSAGARVGRLAGAVIDSLLDLSVVGGYTRWGYQVRSRLPGWPPDPPPNSMAGKVAVVTGANAGLGKAMVAGLAGLGARVHLVVRNAEKGRRARDELAAQLPAADLTVWRCDVSDLDDVARFAAEFAATEPRLDVLVHNAGVLPATRTTSRQGHELTLATHVLGPVVLTEALRGALAAAGQSRVILVTSGGMYTQRLPVDDLEYRSGRYSGSAAYARTKRVQVALLPVLEQRWRSDGIAVHAMHPGWADTPGVASSLPGFHRVMRPALRDAAQGADTAVWLTAAMPPPPPGELWHDRRTRSPHRLPWTRHDESEAWGVWRRLAEAVGIEP